MRVHGFLTALILKGAVKVSLELSTWYKQLSEMYGCMFLDAAKVCAVSSADGVHLDIKNQRYLGEAIYKKLKDEGFC